MVSYSITLARVKFKWPVSTLLGGSLFQVEVTKLVLTDALCPWGTISFSIYTIITFDLGGVFHIWTRQNNVNSAKAFHRFQDITSLTRELAGSQTTEDVGKGTSQVPYRLHWVMHNFLAHQIVHQETVPSSSFLLSKKIPQWAPCGKVTNGFIYRYSRIQKTIFSVNPPRPWGFFRPFLFSVTSCSQT